MESFSVDDSSFSVKNILTDNLANATRTYKGD